MRFELTNIIGIKIAFNLFVESIRSQSCNYFAQPGC